MDNTPLKPLRSITPLRNNLNSSIKIASGLGEIDDDLEDLQKDLKRAERGIYMSTEISGSLSSSFVSPINKKINRSVDDYIKSEEEDYRDEVAELERENYTLNTDLLRVTEENKKLVTEILQKNLRIRELGRLGDQNVRNSREFQKVSSDLHILRTENLRLSRELESRDSQLSNLRTKLSESSAVQKINSVAHHERLQKYVEGIEEEKSKISESEEFMKKQISLLKNDLRKLQDTQNQSLELTRVQEMKFKEQKKKDQDRIREMKNKYESKFEEIKKEFHSSHEKMKDDYKNDILYYKKELEKCEEEIMKLRKLVEESNSGYGELEEVGRS